MSHTARVVSTGSSIGPHRLPRPGGEVLQTLPREGQPGRGWAGGSWASPVLHREAWEVGGPGPAPGITRGAWEVGGPGPAPRVTGGPRKAGRGQGPHGCCSRASDLQPGLERAAGMSSELRSGQRPRGPHGSRGLHRHP